MGKTLLDRGLDLGIERRGRLVEHEDRRVLQKHARDGDALALSAREFDAALADQGVVAPPAVEIGQTVTKSCACAWRAASIDLVLVGVGPTVADVLARSSDAAAKCPA